MSEVEQAIAQIADIRAQLAASTRFRGFAPGAVGVIGLLSLLVTVLQVAWPARFAAGDGQYVVIWGLLMAGGCLLMAMEAVIRTRRQNARRGDGMAHPMLRSALRIVGPATLLAAVVPLAVMGHVPQAAWIIPGFWQMLIGMVAFASYGWLPRAIVWPGGWFLLCGAGGMFLAGAQGGLSPLLVGPPFIIGHFVIAWTLTDRERIRRGHD